MYRYQLRSPLAATTLGSCSQYFPAQPMHVQPVLAAVLDDGDRAAGAELGQPHGAELSGLLQALLRHLRAEALRVPLVGNEVALGVAEIRLRRHVLGELAVDQDAQLVLLRVAGDQRQALAVAALGIGQRLVGHLLAHVAGELHRIAPAVGQLLGDVERHGPAPAGQRRERGIGSEVRGRLGLEPVERLDRAARAAAAG